MSSNLLLRTYRTRVYDRELCADFKRWYKSKGYVGSVRFRNGKIIFTTHWGWDWQDLFCEYFDYCMDSTDKDIHDTLDLKFMLFTEYPTEFFCWLEINGIETLYMSAYDIRSLASEFHSRGSEMFS